MRCKYLNFLLGLAFLERIPSIQYVKKQSIDCTSIFNGCNVISNFKIYCPFFPHCMLQNLWVPKCNVKKAKNLEITRAPFIYWYIINLVGWLLLFVPNAWNSLIKGKRIVCFVLCMVVRWSISSLKSNTKVLDCFLR